MTSRFVGGVVIPPSGLVLWLDASQVRGIADGSPVANWSDLSGQGNDATQGTPAKQPSYTASGINGHAGVTFDGVDDFLVTSTFSLNQPVEAIVVVQFASLPAGNPTFVDSAVSDVRALFTDSTPRVSLYAGLVVNGPLTDATTAHTYDGLWNGASSRINKDGGTDMTGSAGTNNAGGVMLGAASPGISQFSPCTVGEVIYYNRALSAAERASIQSYLKRKWGTP